ncbi:MAG: hypothetical protein AAGF66_04400 [Cyanobacteria bacterium P01_H01_bin.119]
MSYTNDWISKLDDSAIAELANTLRRIDPRFMKASQMYEGATRTWFQGKEPYFDVVFETKAEQILWFQITLRGKSLSWNSTYPDQIQAGETDELDAPISKANYSASAIIEGNADLDQRYLNVVIALLKHRSDDPLFNQMATRFETLSNPG